MEFTFTLVIIVITALVSYGGFTNEKIMNDLIFYPPAISQRGQWYRFFSNGLLHADFFHLLFNMFSLYMFGEIVEKNFSSSLLFGEKGKLIYLAMYIIALPVCLIPTYLKNRNNYQYRSLGASGAVSAVVFVGILLFPTAKLGFFFIPPIIPGYIFGPLYLLVSTMLEKRGQDNINHSAHIWGALFGVAFTIALSYALQTDYDVVQEFVAKVKDSLGI